MSSAGFRRAAFVVCEPLEPRRLPAATVVTDAIVAPRATWRCLDDGTDPGAAWRQPAFGDAGWAEGRAELGDGDGDEATRVRYGPSSAGRFITTYFRHRFDVPLGSRAQYVTPLPLRLRRDDGAVVYLNGREVARSNMPTGR